MKTFKLLLIGVLSVFMVSCSWLTGLGDTTEGGGAGNAVEVSGNITESSWSTAIPNLLATAIPSYLKTVKSATTDDCNIVIAGIKLSIESFTSLLSGIATTDNFAYACVDPDDYTFELGLSAGQWLIGIFDISNNAMVCYLIGNATDLADGTTINMANITVNDDGSCEFDNQDAILAGLLVASVDDTTVRSILKNGTYTMTITKASDFGAAALKSLEGPPPAGQGGFEGEGEFDGGDEGEFDGGGHEGEGEREDDQRPEGGKGPAVGETIKMEISLFSEDETAPVDGAGRVICLKPEMEDKPICGNYDVISVGGKNVLQFKMFNKEEIKKCGMNGCNVSFDEVVNIIVAEGETLAGRFEQKQIITCDDGDKKDTFEENYDESSGIMEVAFELQLIQENTITYADFVAAREGTEDKTIEISDAPVATEGDYVSLHAFGNCEFQEGGGVPQELIDVLFGEFLCPSLYSTISSEIEADGYSTVDAALVVSDGVFSLEVCGQTVPIDLEGNLFHLSGNVALSTGEYLVEIEGFSDSKGDEDFVMLMIRLYEGITSCDQIEFGPGKEMPCIAEFVLTTDLEKLGQFGQGGGEGPRGSEQYMGGRDFQVTFEGSACEGYSNEMNLSMDVDGEGIPTFWLDDEEIGAGTLIFNQAKFESEAGSNPFYKIEVGMGSERCGDYYKGDRVVVDIDIPQEGGVAGCHMHAEKINCGWGEGGYEGEGEGEGEGELPFGLNTYFATEEVEGVIKAANIFVFANTDNCSVDQAQIIESYLGTLDYNPEDYGFYVNLDPATRTLLIEFGLLNGEEVDVTLEETFDIGYAQEDGFSMQFHVDGTISGEPVGKNYDIKFWQFDEGDEEYRANINYNFSFNCFINVGFDYTLN